MKLSDPTQSSMDTRVSPMETSQDTIWAVLRNAPKKAQRELLAHPDSIMPQTPNPETANMNNNPRSMSTNQLVNENGITTHPNRLKKSVNTGAKTKPKVLAFVGITVSLSSNFSPSAKGCNNPKKPTTFGPVLCCIAAMILRSAKVR